MLRIRHRPTDGTRTQIPKTLFDMKVISLCQLTCLVIVSRRTKPDSDKVVSFVPPETEDGASIVQGGGFYGSYLDFDPYVKNDIDLIYKYRDMALHPEVEMSIDDICNDSLVYDDERVAVNLNLDKTSLVRKY